MTNVTIADSLLHKAKEFNVFGSANIQGANY